MRNIGTILLSAGVLLVGFSFLSPLLFFLIEATLGTSGDTGMLLEMEHAAISFVGLLLLALGSIFSEKRSPLIIASSSLAGLALVSSFFVTDPKGAFRWVVTCCYYLGILTAFGAGIATLHKKGSKKR